MLPVSKVCLKGKFSQNACCQKKRKRSAWTLFSVRSKTQVHPTFLSPMSKVASPFTQVISVKNLLRSSAMKDAATRCEEPEDADCQQY